LAAVAVTCRAIGDAACRQGALLWRALATDALGASVCALHAAARPVSSAGGETEADDRSDATFWRRLARATVAGGPLRWDAALSGQLYSSGEARSLLRCCAHAAAEVGEVVLLIGGSRMDAHPASGVVVVDCRRLEVRAAELSPDSETPAPRLRHGACGVAAVGADAVARVVVLGGVTEEWSQVEEMHSASQALVLDILDPEARCVRWRTQELRGEAPGGGAPLFHHVMCAFDRGRRIVVWGGDTQDFGDFDGHAIASAECQARQAYVFVLDVPTWTWERVRTAGDSPGHRSLAEGVVHAGRLVILGGSTDPKPPRAFAFGELAVMEPSVLDLATWTWRTAPNVAAQSDAAPAPRTRFAVERRGDWLVGVGGRGSHGEMLDDIWQLDLRSMSWRTTRPRGDSRDWRRAFCASSMCGGLILGGLVHGVICAKADALLLDPGAGDEPESEAEGEAKGDREAEVEAEEEAEAEDEAEAEAEVEAERDAELEVEVEAEE